MHNKAHVIMHIVPFDRNTSIRRKRWSFISKGTAVIAHSYVKEIQGCVTREEVVKERYDRRPGRRAGKNQSSIVSSNDEKRISHKSQIRREECATLFIARKKGEKMS